MSETERVDQIVAQRARHRIVTAVIVVVLILSLGWNAWQQIAAQTRATEAQTSAVSLAEQVQHACDSQGSLDLHGRNLCEQADDVVEGISVAGPAGPGGPQGPQGERGFTGAQGPQGRTGPPGETGPRGPLGPRGAAGADGEPGTDGKAGAVGATGAQGPQGEQGDVGPQGIQGPIGLTGPAGADSTVPGPQGIRGPQGTAKPGTYACPDGEFMTGFTVDPDGGVTLACQDPIPPVIETP